MGHKVLINTSKKPIEHPVTGQLIPGGHTYTVPDEDELKAQEKALKAWEKAKAKEAAEAEARAQREEAERLKAEEEAKAKAEGEAKAKAEEEARAKAEEEAKTKAAANDAGGGQ